ncbi:MAG: formylglycine-generating enzyme family protein [Treponema sp.]|jgi:formylglycine-generating enzyme required for sulfatase activity|nr:formylglycine-generating enzyme family protein [Treponema sp.]
MRINKEDKRRLKWGLAPFLLVWAALPGLFVLGGCPHTNDPGNNPPASTPYDPGPRPSVVPDGFVWVPGASVTGSDAYKASFVYPEGATYAGETGVQYGAFVEGRAVTVKSFFMAKYEVAYGWWHEVYQWAVSDERGAAKYVFANQGRETPRSAPGAAPTDQRDHPVIDISWRDAVVWCNAASEKDGLDPVYYRYGGEAVLRQSSDVSGVNQAADRAVMKREHNGYRLPTMCEREFAARGGDPSLPDWLYRYSGSDDPDEVAWYWRTSGAGLSKEPGYEADPTSHPDYGAHAGGEKKPNRLDIYDLSGNVMEWGWDWMHFAGNGILPASSGFGGKKLDPSLPEEGPPYGQGYTQKPMSGGSWYSSSPYSLNAMWWGYTTNYHDTWVGFRVVRGISEE